MRGMNRNIEKMLAPFIALGATANVPTTAEGKRLVWGIQCHKTATTDSHVPQLLSMPELRAVGLSQTEITNASLPILAQLPHLESLDLEETGIDDSGLAALGACPSLEFLHVRRTRVTPEGIKRIQLHFPNCEIVSDFGD
jgi:hypothetical protein